MNKWVKWGAVIAIAAVFLVFLAIFLYYWTGGVATPAHAKSVEEGIIVSINKVRSTGEQSGVYLHDAETSYVTPAIIEIMLMLPASSVKFSFCGEEVNAAAKALGFKESDVVWEPLADYYKKNWK